MLYIDESGNETSPQMQDGDVLFVVGFEDDSGEYGTAKCYSPAEVDEFLHPDGVTDSIFVTAITEFRYDEEGEELVFISSMDEEDFYFRFYGE